MTKTRIVYRIGPTCDGDDCFWHIAEAPDNHGALIEAPAQFQTLPTDIHAAPATLRAIGAALVRIADAQDRMLHNKPTA